MFPRLRFALLCLFLLAGVLSAFGQQAYIDLRSGWSDGSEVIKLQGLSEFYWRQFLTPQDFARGLEHEPAYVRIPDTWTNYRMGGGELPPDGYATYRFFIVLPVENKEGHYGLRVPVVYSSYRLWVNGEYCHEMGSVDSSPFKAVSKAGVSLVPVHASGSHGVDTLEVVLQVANYGYPVAGLPHALSFGRVGALVAHSAMQIRIEFLLLGVLSLLIVFCAVFLHIACRGYSSVWLFFSGFFFILHLMANNGNFFFELFPSVPWIAFHMLRYATLLVSSLFALMFVRQVFISHRRLFLFYPLAVLGIIQALYVIMAPASHYTVVAAMITVYLGLVALAVVGLLVPLIRRRKNRMAVSLFVGILLLSACYGLDSLLHQYRGNLLLPFTQLGAILLTLSVMLATVWQILSRIVELENQRRSYQSERSHLRTSCATKQEERNRLEIELALVGAQLEVQHWADRGYTLLTETIAQSPRQVAPLSQALLTAFCQYISVPVGALYMARYSVETMQANLVLTAHVGLTDRMRREQAVVMENEGLVGAVYAKNSMQYLTDLPNDFLTISTGLGECTPPALLILPLQADSGVIGVLALGKLEALGNHEIAFAQRASLIISNGLMHVSSVEENLRMTREALESREEMLREQEELRLRILRLEASLQEKDALLAGFGTASA